MNIVLWYVTVCNVVDVYQISEEGATFISGVDKTAENIRYALI